MRAFLLALALAAAAIPALAQHDGHGEHAHHPSEIVEGEGLVEAIDEPGGAIAVAAEASERGNWHSAVMIYRVANPSLLRVAVTGDRISLRLVRKEIVSIRRR